MNQLSRLFQLYNMGGLTEVTRGIRDWLLTFDAATPVIQYMDSSTLSVSGVSVEFVVDSREALWRASGNGERNVMADFVENLRLDDVVWDIGANHGSYSFLAASAGADVHAFEPGEEARVSIRRHQDRNNIDFEIHPFALGDENMEMVLAEANRSGVRHLTDEHENGDLVQVIRGDELDIDGPDIVKIDVEGAEVPVIEGLGENLKNCRLCYVEVHGDTQDQVKELLRRNGFKEISEMPTLDHPILKAECSMNN